MMFNLGVNVRALWIAVTFLSLVGCAEVNQGLTSVNDTLISGRALASPVNSSMEARIEVPNDARIGEAFDAALPRIQRVLATHKCINGPDGMFLLNKEAVPGVAINSAYHYPIFATKFHNKRTCLSVRGIDKVAMPALNALHMRVSYYAEDSGEAVNFAFMFKRIENGQWMLGAMPYSI